MAWYNSIIEGGSVLEKASVSALATQANPNIGILANNKYYFQETEDFLSTVYRYGQSEFYKFQVEQESLSFMSKAEIESVMYDLAYNKGGDFVPFEDEERWLLFTDLRGWEINEEVWINALKGAQDDGDDRAVIPYIVLSHMAENLIIYGFKQAMMGDNDITLEAWSV